jgi:aromatic ring-opening dioxygenase catalytic subunit (LigB family)
MITSRALLVPHLPTLLVDEHRRHRTDMLVALEEAAARFAAEEPEAVVVLSARWTAAPPFRVDGGRRHRTITDYTGFGVEVRYDCPGHPAIARALVEAGTRAGLGVALSERGVDSGVAVPMHFLLPARKTPIVPLSLPERPAAECRAWGAAIREALAARPERIAFVVGGLLSHNEHAWHLRREVAESLELDRRVLEALARADWDAVTPPDRALAEKAQPEAGLRHLEVLRGFLGDDLPGAVLCYETAPGTGAALVEFEREPAPAM